jgi:hypothetical protein
MQSADSDDIDLAIEVEPEPEPGPGATSESDAAAEAFARLEREMALMRRAVEHLATERADIVIPDYSKTLVSMTGNLASLDRSVKSMADMPALQITPEDMGKRIEQTARSARSDYEATIQQWRAAAYGLELGVSEALGSAIKHEAQIRRERQFFAAGAAVAALLMTFLPGIVARELPASWQLPERMARRIVDAPSIIDAGVHLIRSADPRLWAAIEEAAALSDANPEAIKRCKAAARKTKRPVSCLVRVDR